MKILVQHPTGNQNVRVLLNALAESGALAEFNTTIATDPNAFWLKYIPENIRYQLLRRTYPLSASQICTHPLMEIARMLLPKIGLKNLVEHESGWASVDSVYKDLDQKVSDRLPALIDLHKITGVYAYEDGALSTFKKAKNFGLRCYYELPIAYWETGSKLMFEESKRLPNWAETLSGGIRHSEEKKNRKIEELELADVVMVPGEFVKDSLPLWAAHKNVIVAPFGSPKIVQEPNFHEVKTSKTSAKPLRVLFVGSMGQRKGLGDLFNAIRILDNRNVELVVMGSLMAPLEFYKSQLQNFTYETGRPHNQVLELMRSCDVFCLPSIVEGRALVMQEAMSQGLPLIITPNTGGSDLVIEGETGFLIPIRSPEKIAEKLNWFLENRDQVAEMGNKAKAHAATYTWKMYGDKIIEGLINSASEVTV